MPFGKGYCPVCGGSVEQGCHPTVRRLGEGLDGEALTADDWREVYLFIKYVYLPFIHRIVARARARKSEINVQNVQR